MAHENADHRGMAVKVYVVLERVPGAAEGEPNVRVQSVSLTRSLADEEAKGRDTLPIEKHVARKCNTLHGS